MSKSKEYVQRKFSIVIPNRYILKHDIPIVTMAMFAYYWFSILKFAWKEKTKPFFFIKNGKTMNLQGVVEDHEEKVFTKIVENKNILSSPNPIRSEIVFHTGNSAIKILKQLVMDALITERDFKEILNYRYFYVREEKIFYDKKPDVSVIVAISCHKLANEARKTIEKNFFGK